MDVTEGQVIGLLNGKLAVSSDNLEKACLELLEKANAENYELITMFYGEEMKHTEANRIADLIRTNIHLRRSKCKKVGNRITSLFFR